MRITVQLAPRRARSRRAATKTDASADLKALVRRFGGTIAPLHPGTDDPTLQHFFVVDVPDARASELLERLQQHPAVQAAYGKPPEGLP